MATFGHSHFSHGNEFGKWQTECLGDLIGRIDGEAPFPTLDQAEVGSVKARPVSQLL